jgi:hypothetical protein
MTTAISQLGLEMPIVIRRGADFTIRITVRDPVTGDLIDTPTLLPWLSGGGGQAGFTYTLVSTGVFDLLLPRTVTAALSVSTNYAIGYVDAESLHRPLLFGSLTISGERIG